MKESVLKRAEHHPWPRQPVFRPRASITEEDIFLWVCKSEERVNGEYDM